MVKPGLGRRRRWAEGGLRPGRQISHGIHGRPRKGESHRRRTAWGSGFQDWKLVRNHTIHKDDTTTEGHEGDYPLPLHSHARIRRTAELPLQQQLHSHAKPQRRKELRKGEVGREAGVDGGELSDGRGLEGRGGAANARAWTRMVKPGLGRRRRWAEEWFLPSF